MPYNDDDCVEIEETAVGIVKSSIDKYNETKTKPDVLAKVISDTKTYTSFEARCPTINKWEVSSVKGTKHEPYIKNAYTIVFQNFFEMCFDNGIFGGKWVRLGAQIEAATARSYCAPMIAFLDEAEKLIKLEVGKGKSLDDDDLKLQYTLITSFLSATMQKFCTDIEELGYHKKNPSLNSLKNRTSTQVTNTSDLEPLREGSRAGSVRIRNSNIVDRHRIYISQSQNREASTDVAQLQKRVPSTAGGQSVTRAPSNQVTVASCQQSMSFYSPEPGTLKVNTKSTLLSMRNKLKTAPDKNSNSHEKNNLAMQ